MELQENDVSVITVKVPKQLKAEMKKADINWSKYIRQCIKKKIHQQERIEASKALEEIRKRTKPVSNDELLAWIREGRERNY